METKDRIRMIMEDQHMTQQVFADFLQQSPATLSSIFNGRTRPTLQVIDAIKTKIPDISIEWLLYGTGDMYTSHPQDSDESFLDGQMTNQEPTLNFDSPLPVNPIMHQNAGQTVGFQQGVKTTHAQIPHEEIKIIEKQPRKVTEIRVYYDDQTYETFVPAKK
jgi:transcriptional regulator with XRE-family HTH domain